MPSKIKIALVLMLLPLASICHDVYYWQENNLNFEFFKLSELGFMFTEYAPDLYKEMIKSAGDENWKTYAIPVLKIKTAIILGFPALVFFLLGLRDLVKDFFTIRSVPKHTQGDNKSGARRFDPETAEKFFGSGKGKF